MLHGTLALLNRSLKRDARQRSAHAVRLGSVLLILLFLVQAHATSGGVGAPGLGFFQLITWLNLALITLAGCSYFATAITEEKEEGTLGLLQLAGVSPLGLLLGKSTSRLVTALLLFLGQFPFALLAISLGGVTAHQILAVYVALGAYLVLVANVALFCSVIFQRSGAACTWMLLVLGLFLGGVHAGRYSLSVLTDAGSLSASQPLVSLIGRVLAVLEPHSIISRIDAILTTGFQQSAFSPQVMLSLAGAGLAFGLSWLTFEKFTRYTDVGTPARGWLPRMTRRHSSLIERPWRNALVWKDYNFITGGHTLAIFKLILYSVLLGLMGSFEEWVRQLTGLSFIDASRVLMLCAIAAELLVYASRVFHEEVKWGTLPNLALLPRSRAWIGASKVLGCLLALIPAVALLMGLYAFCSGRVRPLTDLFSEAGPWFLLTQFVILLHLIVWCSLVVKWGAPAAAVAILLIVDLLMLPVISTLSLAVRTSSGSDLSLVSPILYISCLACAALQFLIMRQFRLAAAS